MDVKLTEHQGQLYLEYYSQYATGAISVQNPEGLVKAIEEVCGKGSFCLYKGKGDRYPEAVDYFTSKELNYPTITFFMQGVKTGLIEQSRELAIKFWGNIPEMEVGWLENQCKSYIEDL